jgi:hypothetical protein
MKGANRSCVPWLQVPCSFKLLRPRAKPPRSSLLRDDKETNGRNEGAEERPVVDPTSAPPYHPPTPSLSPARAPQLPQLHWQCERPAAQAAGTVTTVNEAASRKNTHVLHLDPPVTCQ